MERIQYRQIEVIETEKIFEVEDYENVFLKARYNHCNASTYPHFAQFRDGNDIVIINIQNYHSVSVNIERDKDCFSAGGLRIKTFLEGLKNHDKVEIITREEFFDYYKRLTEINELSNNQSNEE